MMGRKKLFWVLQIGGWSLYYLIHTYFITNYQSYSPKEWLLHSITFVLGLLITTVLRFFYQFTYKRIEKFYLLPIIIAVGATLSTVLWFVVDLFVSHFFWDIDKTDLIQKILKGNFIQYNYFFVILLISWSALYFGIKFALDWQNEKKRSIEAELMAQRAQMEMLRYQLNPHFLFNSLNSIRVLIDENKEHAKDMITELSEFLRYSLLHKNTIYVSLSNETEAIKHYFSIEKKRFEEKLYFEFNISEEVKSVQIPTFLLHPLIENAVKYGMKTSSMPLKITIDAKKNNNGLLIEVCNTGKWIERENGQVNPSGTGTGLENVKRRLSNAYGENYRLNILKKEDRTCVQIIINKDF